MSLIHSLLLYFLQISNIIPAQIRLDQNQLNQLINSNLQIKLSQIQQNSLGKNVNVTKGLVQVTQNQIKADSGPFKTLNSGKDGGEQKIEVAIPTLNGSNERLSNSFGSKASLSVSDLGKQGKILRIKL